MKLNDALDRLLDLRVEENEPARYQHSEEYYELYYKLDDMTRLMDELTEKIGCPLDVYWKLHTQAHIYDIIGTPLRILRVTTDTVAVRPEKFKEGHCFYPLADYKKSWFLKKDKSE